MSANLKLPESYDAWRTASPPDASSDPFTSILDELWDRMSKGYGLNTRCVIDDLVSEMRDLLSWRKDADQIAVFRSIATRLDAAMRREATYIQMDAAMASLEDGE